MSLKKVLKIYLEHHKTLSLYNLETICKQEGKKFSNAERRLRELMKEDTHIKPIRNQKGVITAYEYQAMDVEKWLSQWKPIDNSDLIRESRLF